jgi:hydrogenase-4 component B
MDRMLDLDTILTVITIWVGIGVIALIAPRRTGFIARGLFPISALFSLALAGLALHGLFIPPQATILRLGLPGLPFHLRLDSLSAYFLAVIGAASAGTSIFSAGYLRKGGGTPPGLQCLQGRPPAPLPHAAEGRR